MALIPCPNCGKQVSFAALACPNCKKQFAQLQHRIVSPTYAQSPTNYWKIASYTLITLLLVGLGVWFYLTPYLAIRDMRSAALNRDAKTFCAYIDFPVLKDNLKSELNAKMLAEMNKDQKLKDNPFSGLAMTMGPAIVNNMVDGFVSPAGIELLFKGDFNPNQQGASQAPAVATQTFSSDFINEEKGELTTGYNSYDEFEVSYKPKTGGGSKLIFERRGLWSWKLINMKLD